MSESCNISVSEAAKLVGLSRQRFYQLIGTTFPEPSRTESGRPYYNEEQQEICLGVRRQNCGIDGKPVLFYSQRSPTKTEVKRKPKVKSKPKNNHDELIESLKSLGLTTSNDEIESVLTEIYPSGTSEIDPGEVVRNVFLSIKRKNSTDNVGR